jgi:hypothetical protein
LRLGLRTPLAVAAPLVATVFFAASLVSASAAKAQPFAIGQGHVPGVAIDNEGTSYIAWNGLESNASLNFCRLPRGAAACDLSGPIAAPGTSLSRPFVQVQGNVVRVVAYRYGLSGPPFDGVLLFTSTDGGASFGPGVLVGSVPFHDAVSGPGATVSLITSAVTEGMLFQNVPTDGSSVGTQKANFGTTHPYLGTVALIDGTTPLAVFDSGSSMGVLRRYDGSGSLNDPANWTPPQDIGYADDPRLAAGPSGVFLLTTDSPDRHLQVRRYLGDSGFGPTSPVGAAPGESAQDYMTQDPGGQLHVVLPQITADGSRLMHATSNDGVTWTQTQHAFEPLALQTRAAVAADHTGVVVWESASNPPIINVMAISGGASAPVLGRTVTASVVRGKVLVGTRGGPTIRGGRAGASQRFRTPVQFEPLRQERTIPVGSFLDTTRGTVELVSATGRGSRTQSGQFSAGLFQVLQSRARKAKGLTELRMKGGSFKRCGAAGRRATAALSRRRVRQLRANVHGRYQTRSRGSAATARGTIWTATDRCDGTLTSVKRGRVAVRDFRRKRTVIVRAGKSYFAGVR